MNNRILMSGVDYFDDASAINPFMDTSVSVNRDLAKAEHQAIESALQKAGVEVIRIDPPVDCQDGVYTANWGLCRGDKVVLSALPNVRQPETPYAARELSKLGLQVINPPEGVRFSGQGDALPCGNLLFCGSQYRTDPAIYPFLTEQLGFEVIGLQTIPLLDQEGQPAINHDSGWPDSFFYDIDLALAVINESLIAWCPEAFIPESQQKLKELDIDKIEVSLSEAKEGFACNLVSTGEAVIMSAHAPDLTAELKRRGLQVFTPEIQELAKGGGFIRCTTLTLT